MIKRYWFLIGLALVLMICGGCAVSPSPSRLEMNYGASYHLAKFNQILNPQGEKNLEPVMGFDGKAAQATMERYQKGFEKPSPPPVYTINIGGLGSTGQ